MIILRMHNSIKLINYQPKKINIFGHQLTMKLEPIHRNNNYYTLFYTVQYGGGGVLL